MVLGVRIVVRAGVSVREIVGVIDVQAVNIQMAFNNGAETCIQRQRFAAAAHAETVEVQSFGCGVPLEYVCNAIGA